MKTKLIPQKALDSTKRVQYVDKDVLDTWPDTTGKLEYFKLDKYISAEELDKEYEKRGLLPAPYALCAADAADPSSIDKMKYVATQWKDPSGNFCYLAFDEWRSDRGVSVGRRNSGWGVDWFLAGVPVASSSQTSESSTERSDTESLELPDILTINGQMYRKGA